MLTTKILNSKGEAIVLNGQEANQARYNTEQIQNSLGYEVDVTTLTGISKSIVEQKFFQIAPADFVPVKVGDNAWTSDILTYRDFSLSDDFEDGVVNTAGSNSRIAEVDSGIDAVRVPVINWAKQVSWSIFDLKLASQSGNWSIVESKERARKKDWDLGIQRITFLGSNNNSSVKGLLTQDGVTSNTTVISKYIKDMTSEEFNALGRNLLEAYRANAQRTTMPTHFAIPEADFNGLATFPDATYPLKTKLEILVESFRLLTGNPNFVIKPLTYADQANNADVAGLNLNRYVLYNYDMDTVRMDLPVDYTNTQANTVNGLQFQNAAYGQYTGVQFYREREALYFDWAA